MNAQEKKPQRDAMAARIEKSGFPLVTVGTVVLNREWIIGKMLDSLLHQTYPHDKIFVLIVDGESKDRTLEIIREILEKADFSGFKIISKKCSIPEGRNICVENMRGDLLFSLDSDVIMGQTAIEDLFAIMIQEKVEIVNADCIQIYVNGIEEVDAKINEVRASHKSPLKDNTEEVPATGMGHALVTRRVLSEIRFDPDLTICEDLDFSVRAREKGLKIILAKHVLTFDVNIWKKGFSDIHMEIPIRQSLRGVRKKARASALTYSFTLTFKDSLEFFWRNKRYPFYLGYIPAFILTVYGILAKNLLVLFFPAYLLFFALWQIRKRGSKLAVQSVLRSLIVGVPRALWLVYYFAKYTLRTQRNHERRDDTGLRSD